MLRSLYEDSLEIKNGEESLILTEEEYKLFDRAFTTLMMSKGSKSRIFTKIKESVDGDLDFEKFVKVVSKLKNEDSRSKQLWDLYDLGKPGHL